MHSHRSLINMLILCLLLVGTSHAIGSERQRAITARPPLDATQRPPLDDNRLRPPLPDVSKTAENRSSRERLAHLTDDEFAMVQQAAGDRTLELEIGGNDVVVIDDPADAPTYTIDSAYVAVANNGDVWVTVGFGGDPLAQYEYFKVYRSTDNGNTFDDIDQYGIPGHFSVFRPRDLDATYGDNPVIILTYMSGDGFEHNIYTRFYDADTGGVAPGGGLVLSGDFNETDYIDPQLVTDSVTWGDEYYVYLVAAGKNQLGDGDDIWFARSIDLGTTWETPYVIAALTGSNNLMYARPQIAYGTGGAIHVAWTYTERNQSTFSDQLRYARAASYADTPGDWGPIWGWTGLGSDRVAMDISSSLLTDDVVILYAQDADGQNDPAMIHSADSGASWNTAAPYEVPWDRGGDLEYSLLTGEFAATGLLDSSIFGTDYTELVITRSPQASPGNWDPLERFSDSLELHLRGPHLALDPSRDHRIATSIARGDGLRDVLFDAEWRGDAGYPNFEPGMPLALDHGPVSPPVVVDLDDDGDLEILFSNDNNELEARHHDGEMVDGWPAALSARGSRPAIGVLNGNELSVVVGTDDGQVHSFNVDGTQQSGWPVSLDTEAATHVSIGALGGPYLRTIVACSGNKLTFLGYDAEEPVDAPGWIVFAGDINSPAAIGDIDDDGVTDVVFGAGSVVYAVNTTDLLFSWDMEYTVYDAVTLGDIDLDGDLEIAAGNTAGQVYLLDHDGATLPGFPFVATYDQWMTSTAWADVRGGPEPELAVGTLVHNVHLLAGDGSQFSGYPVVPGEGSVVYDEPIIGHVVGGQSDVVIGSEDGSAYAWNGDGELHDGWPKPLGDASPIRLSPAIADLDLDGRNEVVILGPNDLMVMDVGSATLSVEQSWPMSGHDPQNTGCSDCPEDVATGVDDDDVAAAVTRVQFAGAFPNPVAASATQFRFAVPVRAQARLEVFDVRGRRVRSILQAEVAAGEHTIGWNGRDGAGRAVASGQYLARLRVEGPGVRENLTRRVTVLR